MTLNSREISQASGAPVEIYDFVVGPNHYRYTSGDVEVVYLGATYIPVYIKRDQVDQSQEQEAASLELEIDESLPLVSLFKTYLPDTPVALTVFRNHRGDSEFAPVFIGTVDSVEFTPGVAKLTCPPVFNVLSRSVPVPRYQRQCNKMLYSSACGVDEYAFTTGATVSAVSGFDITAAAFATKPDGWFNNGWLAWGIERRFIVNHVGDTVSVISPFAGLPVGDTVSATAGCARTEGDCITKFNNIVNHLGFPRIPTKTPMQGV